MLLLCSHDGISVKLLKCKNAGKSWDLSMEPFKQISIYVRSLSSAKPLEDRIISGTGPVAEYHAHMSEVKRMQSESPQ